MRACARSRGGSTIGPPARPSKAERALVEALGGGCQTPIGALATPLADGTIELVAAVIALDGSKALRAQGPRRSTTPRRWAAPSRRIFGAGGGRHSAIAPRSGRG